MIGLLFFCAAELVLGGSMYWTLVGTNATPRNKLFSMLTLTVLVAVVSCGIYLADEEKTEAAKKAEDAWIANGCPTYVGECGSKHPYACEKKAAVVGRNRVDDIFVEAKATCSPHIKTQ